METVQRMLAEEVPESLDNRIFTLEELVQKEKSLPGTDEIDVAVFHAGVSVDYCSGDLFGDLYRYRKATKGNRYP